MVWGGADFRLEAWRSTSEYRYTAESRYEPKPCGGAVCVGADSVLSSLPPTPIATSQKEDKRTKNSVRMLSIERNNNHV